jgi:hypothetical protein
MEDLKLEKWKEIKGFDGKYLISTYGNCKIANRVNNTGYDLLTQRIDWAGYATVRLSHKGETVTMRVHRLVAEAFVPNHINKPYVNHINGIKTANYCRNLEWVTHSENMEHAHKLKLIPKTNDRKVVDSCTGKKYPNIKAASVDLGKKYSTVRNYLNGSRKNKTCLRYSD